MYTIVKLLLFISTFLSLPFFSIKKNQYSVILVQRSISQQIISLKQFAIYDVT